MTSEIRVNKIENRSGLGTVTFADTGVDLAGITTAATLKVGTGVTASSDGDIFATGVCTATSFSGDGSNLTGLSGVSVANQSDNRVITNTGTTDALNAETNLTFDGTELKIGGDSGVSGTFGLEVFNTDSNEGTALIAGDAGARLDIMDSGSSERVRIAAAGAIYFISYKNGDDIIFQTTNGSGTGERLRIDSTGNLKFNSGYGSVTTAFGVRAWVSFNGTGTPAIRGDGGVSSVGDNDTGDFTVNFDSNMPDVNYAVGGLSENWEGTNNDSYTQISGYTGGAAVGSYRFVTLRSRFDQQPPERKDPPFVQLIFVR